MTIRYRFEQVCAAFMVGLFFGLLIGTHLYTIFT